MVLLAVLLTLGAAPGVLRLKLRTDGHVLVPADAPEVVLDRSIREEFGVEDLIVVLIRSEHPRGIFNPGSLRLLQELTRQIEKLDGMSRSRVSSLETEASDHYRPGTLEFRRFLEPLPRSDSECERLRRDLEAIKIFTGSLVSYDGRSTAILVGVPPGGDRSGLVCAIQDLVAAVADVPETIHVIGAPVAEALLGIHILEDLGVPPALLGQRSAPRVEGGSWPPKTLYELRRLVGRHVGLVPMAGLFMAAVFFASFRRLAATALPLLEVGACLAFVFGLLGWCGVPVYLTVTVMPVILTAIGVADEIHVFSRYRRERRERPGETQVSAVIRTMDEMHVPVVKTSVTTAVAFLAFATSPIAPVRAFGVFTAVGVFYCMLFSLTVIPALLVLGRPEWFVVLPRARELAVPQVRGRLLTAAASVVVRRRFLVLGLTLLVVATTPLGVSRVRVQDSWISGFHRQSDFFQATELFNSQFFGTHQLIVCVDTGREVFRGELPAEVVDHSQVRLPAESVGDPARLVGRWIKISLAGEGGANEPNRPREWRSWIETAATDGERVLVTMPRRTGSPKFFLRLKPGETVRYEISAERLMVPGVLRQVEGLGAFLESQRHRAVGGVLGPADYIGTTNFIISGRDRAARRVPDDPQRIRSLWGHYGRIRGEKRLRELVDAAYERGLVTVYLKNANFVDTRHLMEEIRTYQMEHLRPHGIEVALAGDVAVSQALVDGIVKTQVGSLLLSLVGVLAVASLLSRSFRWGLYCVIPCTFAVVVNFAVHGWAGIPLGVATSMFAGMTLGIGVDYAIHLVERFRLASSRGLGVDAALVDAVTAAGPAILTDGFAVALGFGVLALSQVPANARLGAITVVCVLSCLAATMLLLPALLRVMSPPTPRTGRSP